MTGWRTKAGALLGLALLPVVAAAQAPLAYDTTYRTTYYEQKRSLYEALPNTRGEVIFLGNSITDTAEWSELFGDQHVKNRGISGDITFGVLARLGEVTASQPTKVFLLIGINDLSRNIPEDLIFRNYQRIVQRIRAESPRTKVYLQSLLPTNNSFPNFPKHQGHESQLKSLNDKLQALASQTGQTFVDLRPSLADDAGRLDARYTNDGLHLNGAGYLRWVAFLRQNHWMK